MASVIENVGAITRLEIPDMPSGGVLVLKGTHGVGKSTALSAIQAALREDGRLNLRDGADRGTINFAGAVVRVTRGKTQHGGTLEAESIEGRFSLSDLIDPGISDPARADAARVKALVELSGARADASLFETIAPEPIRAKADDLVTLAAKVKAEWELVARDAENARGIALDKAKRESPPESAVLVGAVDPTELAQRQREAAAKLHRLEGEDKAAAEAARKNQAAAAALETIDIAALDRNLNDASNVVVKAKAQVDTEASKVDALERQLVTAKADLSRASRALMDATRAEKQADTELSAAQRLKEALEASVPPRVDPIAIESARAEVLAAEAAIVANEEIRRNVDQQMKASAFFWLADQHEQRAKRYREAAAKIDGVLSSVVAGMGCRLRVKDCRIVLDTNRGEELFGDLSHGERTLEAIDVALSVLPSGGVLVIDQETFGGLHAGDIAELHAKAVAKNILVITAAVTTDEALMVETVS